MQDNTAAAAAKSLQSCPTLCDPIDSSLNRQEHWSGLPLPSPMHESVYKYTYMYTSIIIV